MLFNKFDIQSICFIFPNIDGNLLLNNFLVPNFKEIIPYLKQSIDITNNMKKNSWILNVPTCFFDNFDYYFDGKLKTKMIWPDMQVDLDENIKKDNVKIETCKSCKYNSSCVGVQENYIKIRGVEGIKAIVV